MSYKSLTWLDSIQNDKIYSISCQSVEIPIYNHFIFSVGHIICVIFYSVICFFFSCFSQSCFVHHFSARKKSRSNGFIHLYAPNSCSFPSLASPLSYRFVIEQKKISSEKLQKKENKKMMFMIPRVRQKPHHAGNLAALFVCRRNTEVIRKWQIKCRVRLKWQRIGFFVCRNDWIMQFLFRFSSFLIAYRCVFVSWFYFNALIAFHKLDI